MMVASTQSLLFLLSKFRESHIESVFGAVFGSVYGFSWFQGFFDSTYRCGVGSGWRVGGVGDGTGGTAARDE